jgi:hypothetical protein
MAQVNLDSRCCRKNIYLPTHDGEAGNRLKNKLFLLD